MKYHNEKTLLTIAFITTLFSVCFAIGIAGLTHWAYGFLSFPSLLLLLAKIITASMPSDPIISETPRPPPSEQGRG